MRVVGSELIVPFAPPRLRIERQDRATEEVIPLSNVSVGVGARVTDWPVKRIQVGIIRSSEPRPSAAVLPTVALPGLAAELPWRWDRIRPPQALAGIRIVRI